jgi:hypothetical protein
MTFTTEKRRNHAWVPMAFGLEHPVSIHPAKIPDRLASDTAERHATRRRLGDRNTQQQQARDQITGGVDEHSPRSSQQLPSHQPEPARTSARRHRSGRVRYWPGCAFGPGPGAAQRIVTRHR